METRDCKGCRLGRSAFGDGVHVCVRNRWRPEQNHQALGQRTENQDRTFPETEKEFGKILKDLRELGPDDLEGKLVIGGFLNHPYGEEQYRCMECMYYLVHRKWCDLLELAVPVEPDWWCRLWRI